MSVRWVCAYSHRHLIIGVQPFDHVFQTRLRFGALDVQMLHLRLQLSELAAQSADALFAALHLAAGLHAPFALGAHLRVELIDARMQRADPGDQLVVKG